MAYNSLSEALRSPNFAGLSSEAKQYVFDKYSASDEAYNAMSEDAKTYVKEKYLGTAENKAEPKIKRKTGIGEDIAIGLGNIAHQGKTALDLLAGAAATYTGFQEDADKIYADMEARQKRRKEELAQLEQGTGGQIISGVSGIAPAILAAPVVGLPAALGGIAGIGALSGATENVQEGAGVPEATGQAMIEAGTNYGAMALPIGRGFVKGAALGAGGNIGSTIATDVTGRALMEGTEAEQRYQTTPQKLIVAGATGAIPGALFGHFNRAGRLETPSDTKQFVDKVAAESEGEIPNITIHGQPADALTAMDETMQVPMGKIQAPQYGLGGKIATHMDQAGREVPKFEPGERVDQVHMDLEAQRIAAEEKQRQIDAAWDKHNESRKTLSQEEAFAEQERLRAEQSALDEQRRTIFESEATGKPFEPSQRSLSVGEATANVFDALAELGGGKMNFLPGEGIGKAVSDLIRALGKAGHDGYQKAVNAAKNYLGDAWNQVKPYFKQAWDFVRSTPEEIKQRVMPYDKFKEEVLALRPDFTEDQIQRAWELKQEQSTKSISEQRAAAQASMTASQLSHQAQRTGDVWDSDTALNIFKTLKDVEDRSLFKEQVQSSGRLQRDAINHPVTTWIYNIATKAIEDARRFARHVLDDFGTGVIPMIRQHSLTLKGAAEMKDYIKWRFANEGNPASKLPATFSQTVRRIHEALNKADKDLIERMNRVLERDGKDPITALDNHMVHYWSGPYRAYIYVKTSTGGSRLAFFVSEKSPRQAQKALDWIKENIPNVDLEKSTGIKFVKTDARGRSSLFDHLLDVSNEKDPAVLDALQAFKDRIAASQEKHLGEQMRQKERVGVKGFLGDKPWKSEADNYADALDSIRRKYDAGYEWIAAQEIRQQIDPVLQAQKNGDISVGNALMLGQRYINHVLGRDVDMNPLTKLADYLEDISPKFGYGRRGFNYVTGGLNKVTIPYLLALKFSQAVQAIAQPFQSVLPKMLEEASLNGGGLNNYLHIPKDFAIGTMDGLFQMMNLISLGKTEPIQMKLYDILNMKDSKAIAQAMKDLDITRMSLTDTGFTREGGALRTLKNVTSDLAFNGTMNLFEVPTRAWAFSAYVRQALGDGFPMETAIKMANEKMDTMVNYNPEASAMALSNLGPFGSEARGLHTFMINYYTQLKHYIDVAAKDKNAAPLLAYLATTFALGGAAGFIGVDVADWAIDLIKSAMRTQPLKQYDSPALQKFTLRQWMLENMPEALSVGPLSTTSKLGLYGSFTTKVVDPSRSLVENLFPKTMASMQILGGVLEAPKLLDESLTDKQRGAILEKLAPKAFTQKIRNAYQNVGGTVYESGEKQAGLPVYQRTPEEQRVSEKFMGTRSLSEMLSAEERAAYLKGEQNISESQKVQLHSLDEMMVNAVKKGMTNFQAKALAQKLDDLENVWGYEPEKLAEHVQGLIDKYNIPSDVLRRIAAIKTGTSSNIRKLESLGPMLSRELRRQKEYGQ